MQLDLYSDKGTKLSKKITLDDSIFNAKVNNYLLSLAIYVYQKNQRQSTAHAKTRAEVRGGGVKPWRQKGTGRARAGSIRSPIWKGGGVVFGPRNKRNYKIKLSRKMRKSAIRSALSLFANEKKLIILDKVNIKDKKLTQQVEKLADKLAGEAKLLFIQDGKQRNLFLGSRNLKKVTVVNVNELSVYDLLNNAHLIILKDALEQINNFWGVGDGVSAKSKASSSTRLGTRGKDSKKEEKTETKAEREKSKVRSGAKVEAEGALDGLDLSTRVLNSLEKAGISDKKKLIYTIKKGEKIEGIGKKSMEKIKKVLKVK
jgi:large subunit ribosomal protein L4